MLKNISNLLSPELLKALCEMGHGDRICIGDGNFPGASIARENGRIFLRADGHGVNAMLDAILQLFPLDSYTDTPVMLMQKMDCDSALEIPIWKEYEATVGKHDARGGAAIGFYERFRFYEEAGKCCCILQTGETSIYANVILQKGVVK